ncbi:uncharacterized protein LOC126902153 [Daktulosphaira vitifoliae]|uniref:uncharacterized protein LOC126902153 n=1 Tax=Daktulosphaira vitifoliae TaxID=58002 RepID=UPI0021A9FD5A|nr:uncharacterized protein LOC126902153 [Daktulosphaira vitifoliae]
MYACPYCNKKSYVKSNLKKHIILIHKCIKSPILNLEMYFSIKMFKILLALELSLFYMTIELNNLLYTLSKKNYFVILLICLILLFLERLVCPNGCGRSYKYKKGLSHHFRYECGKSPMYACPHCQKKSSVKSNLKKHIILVHNCINTDPIFIYNL